MLILSQILDSVAVFDFFKKKEAKPQTSYTGPPLDPEWARNKRGKFHRLSHLDTTAESLKGASGVYVIWHSGVKPGWVYVGRSDDLASAIDAAVEDDDIMSYEINGGLFVTWSPVLRHMQDGVVRFLTNTMKPKIENPEALNIKDGPVKVLAPQRKADCSIQRVTRRVHTPFQRFQRYHPGFVSDQNPLACKRLRPRWPTTRQRLLAE